MTNIKDKLSASVRHAKAGQQSNAAKPAATRAVTLPVTTKHATSKAAANKSTATRSPVAKSTPAKPAVTKPVTPNSAPVSKPNATTRTTRATTADVSQSDSALFPARVWPD